MNKTALAVSASILLLSACQYSHVVEFPRDTPKAWEYVPIKPKGPQPVVRQEPVELKKFTLDAASLFAFNKSDISVKGTAQSQSIAAEISNNLPYVRAVNITGYTDPAGDDETNRQLSLARAQAVAKVLEGNGIPSNLIKTEGRGSGNLVVDDCQERFAKNKTRRDECNKPNRRVEISVIGLQRQPGVPTMIDSKRYEPPKKEEPQPQQTTRPDGLIERIEPAGQPGLPAQIERPAETPSAPAATQSNTRVRDNGWIETVVETRPVNSSR